MIIPEAVPGNILAAAIALYASAIIWAMVRGPDTFLVGLLSGCGSIALGVWIGVAIAARVPLPLPEEDS